MMDTAEGNSKVTAFAAYHGWRNTIVPGETRVHSPDEAYAKLGMYGGDDSADVNIDPDTLVAAFADLGFLAEVEVVRRGQRGVNFLNRYFSPQVWHGDPNSMCNPRRALAKLFVGPEALTQPLVRLGERLAGYAHTDGNTPVLGPLSLVGGALLGSIKGEMTSYFGQISVEDNWPNLDEGEWMFGEFYHLSPSSITRSSRQPSRALSTSATPPVCSSCLCARRHRPWSHQRRPRPLATSLSPKSPHRRQNQSRQL